MPLEPLALTLALVHFGVPLAYYWYAKTVWLPKPWNLKLDEAYKPKVTIILPTYNEARIIEERLNNLYEQDYPKELLSIVVVDSASTDGTLELVEKWVMEHKDIECKILREKCRRGMVPAINYALKTNEFSGDIIVFTDADALWPTTALKNIVKYFADERVGVVTASVTYRKCGKPTTENVYRSYYNRLRVAESKKHSTPIHNGPLIAFRKDLLYKMGLLPEYTGNDDSTPASVAAFMGYRAIQIDEVVVEEYIRKKQFWRKVRRSQHLIIHFLKTKKYVKSKNLYKYSKDLEIIWRIEWFLHIVNPWLLAASFTLFLLSCMTSLSPFSFGVLSMGTLLLGSKAYRTWILQQLCLVIAAIKNLKSIEIAWSK